MAEGRTFPTSVFAEAPKPCKSVKPIDPLQIFIDSPVYHETKVTDHDAYKEGDLDASKPFGKVFQKEKHFEEDVFEPESPYGEKTFTQQHPLFGDFGVKCGVHVRGRVYDPREKQLVESTEYENPDALSDPGSERESRECWDPITLDDPDGDDKPEEFNDQPFFPASPDEQPQTFADDRFETGDQETPELQHEVQEAAPEAESLENPPAPETQTFSDHRFDTGDQAPETSRSQNEMQEGAPAEVEAPKSPQPENVETTEGEQENQEPENADTKQEDADPANAETTGDEAA